MNNESAFINCAEVQTSPKVCNTLLYFTSMWKEFKEKKEIHMKRMFVSQWNWSSDSLDQSHVRSSIWMTAIFFLFMLSRRPSGWNVSMWVDMAKWSGAIVTLCPQNLSQSRGGGGASFPGTTLLYLSTNIFHLWLCRLTFSPMTCSCIFSLLPAASDSFHSCGSLGFPQSSAFDSKSNIQ